MFEETVYPSVMLQAGTGDVVVIYSDSLIEAPLEDVEGMLKRIRKSHYLRREGMQGIAHARAVAAAAGITPPN